MIILKINHYIDGKLINKYENILNEEEKNSKKYKFFLDNISNYIYITDRLVFIRESDDYIFKLDITEKPTCSISLKSDNNELTVNVVSASYKENEKYIDIKYILETDDGEHHIIIETDDN